MTALEETCPLEDRTAERKAFQGVGVEGARKAMEAACKLAGISRQDGRGQQMRGALAAALATAVVVAASASAASDAGPWQVVRSKTVMGELAITATQATIRRPKGIAVRFVGRGLAIYACSKGSSVSSWSRRYSSSGFYVLRYTRGKDTCDVTASVSNRGRAVVTIYKARW